MTGSAGRPPGWRPLFRLPFGGRRVEAEVDDEIAFHLAMREERLRARGLDADAAHAAAHARFGDVDRVRRELVDIDRHLVRRRRAIDYVEDLMKDLVFAIRGLRRAPAFAGAALATLALGIGSATAIFSVAYGVLLRPLPYPDAERLMDISINLSGTGATHAALSAPEYMDLMRETRAFGAVAAWTVGARTLGVDGAPERIVAASATASLFDVLRVRPIVGRAFTAEEDLAGASPVILLGYDLWQRRFGGDPSVVGRPVQMDGIPRVVVGVLPEGVRLGVAEAVTPMNLDPARLPGRGAHFLRVIGRLRPGVTIAQARDELADFARRSVSANPTNYGVEGFTATARPLREAWYGSVRPTMIALVTAVSLLLLLAAVNVANLLLVRGEARQREMGVRVALGAGRTRLVRQLLTETGLLALLGAVIGVPLAALAVRSLLAINPGVIPPGAEVSVDTGVLVAVLAVVALAAVVAGIAPALRAGSTDVRTAIASGSAAGGRAGTRMRSAFVALEVALAAAMLVGAGLVGRSFQHLLSVDPGFGADGERAISMSVAFPRTRYDTSVKILAFTDRVLQRMKALPGVTSVAMTSALPLSGSLQWSVAVDGRPEAMRELPTPHIVMATHDVFRALGIRLVRGRAFSDADGENTQLVTIVNQTMARVYWPGEDAIGKRIHLSGPPQWMTVVGVAADVRLASLAEPPRPAYYVLTPQFARMTGYVEGGAHFVIRTASEPRLLMNAAREIIREQDPELAVHNVRTLDALVTESVARPRFAASVLGAFGLSALLLAVVGVYGVLSYAMERRRRELAVRMALGAQPGQVRRLVMASALTLAGAGIVAGLLASVAGKRIIATLLYEVSPTDVVTLAGVSVALLGAALLASWLPARRATLVSPAEVLRGE